MKKINLLLIVALFLGTLAVSAQKLGHINSGELLNLMPEYKAAQTKIDETVTKKKNELEKAQQALDAKVKAWQEKISKMTEAEIKANQASLEAEQKSLQQEAQQIEKNRQTYLEEVGKEEQNLMKPIQDKAMVAIKKVAATKGLEYVFDISTGGFLVTNGVNILPDVKTELGIK